MLNLAGHRHAKFSLRQQKFSRLPGEILSAMRKFSLPPGQTINTHFAPLYFRIIL